MSISNGYITLAEFKRVLDIADTDTTDDTDLELVVGRASRAIDDFTGRHFYPLVDTYEFDTPEEGDLEFYSADLLEITTLTNGEGGALSSTDYVTRPRNATPITAVRLLPSSSKYWEESTDGDAENAVTVLGFWGYRENYSLRGFTSVGTAAVLTADTTLVVTTPEQAIKAGEIGRIGSELVLCTASSSDGCTVTRGYNGSTAATHDAGSVVYKWNVQEAIAQACSIQAHRYWKRKDSPYGVAGTGELGQLMMISNLDPDVKQLLHRYVRAV